MALIKDVYSRDFFQGFLQAATTVIPAIDKAAFTKRVFTKAFAGMEWKERMKHTTGVLHQYMPPEFSKAVPLLKELIEAIRRQPINGYGIAFMFLPDYIETYGLDDPDSSVQALETVTQFISCEFAVRPFILRYPKQMMKQMQRWSKHKSPHVRRLSSEGCRPRLPWAMAIPTLKKDPSPILPILNNLKKDSDESVRRSVANNLNDIAKDHPDTVLEIARQWSGISKETDAIIKHGSRTLLKAGHPKILRHYGLDAGNIDIGTFTIDTPEVRIGDAVSFSFMIENKSAKSKVVRLEYAIYYNKANGKLSKKVFKISEKNYPEKHKARITKNHSFRIITTRKFYSGKHKISIITNGEEKAVKSFILI